MKREKGKGREERREGGGERGRRESDID